VDAETKAVRGPLVLANSFELNDTSETLPESFDWSNPNAFNYPRSRHPTARYLEERLAGMEGGEDCGVSASGVAAISGAFFTLLSAGDHLISSRICSNGIHGFLVEHFAKRFGVELTLVDTTSPAEGQAAVRPNTKLIHVETPANPTTRVSDIAFSAKQIGAILSGDSTFSGLVMQKPLALV
jgi:methionine-gamma-lyase